MLRQVLLAYDSSRARRALRLRFDLAASMEVPLQVVTSSCPSQDRKHSLSALLSQVRVGAALTFCARASRPASCLCRRPHPSARAVRRRKAFAMTLTDESAIAAAAITGDSSNPKNG